MRSIKKAFLPLFLFTLFTAYQVSITMFTHVHLINGTQVVHSHPFSDKHHSHTKTVLAVIARLSSFHSPESTVSEMELLIKKPVLWILDANQPTPLAASAYFDVINLRAPPAC